MVTAQAVPGSAVEARGADGVLLGERASALETLTARADAHGQVSRSPRTRALYAGDWGAFHRVV